MFSSKNHVAAEQGWAKIEGFDKNLSLKRGWLLIIALPSIWIHVLGGVAEAADTDKLVRA